MDTLATPNPPPALLQIAQWGESVLRQTAQPVVEPQSPGIQALIENLILTMQQSHGVGIAAPQVGESLQLLVVASRPNLRYPHAPLMEPTVMINPRLLSHSDQQVKDWEGCLSVPNLRGRVPRYQAIAIEYQDRQGHSQKVELEDFVARIFQHEYDHLQGKIFVDRVESAQDLISEAEYQSLMLAGESTTTQTGC
jgi:peptide deformylase